MEGGRYPKHSQFGHPEEYLDIHIIRIIWISRRIYGCPMLIPGQSIRISTLKIYKNIWISNCINSKNGYPSNYPWMFLHIQQRYTYWISIWKSIFFLSQYVSKSDDWYSWISMISMISNGPGHAVKAKCNTKLSKLIFFWIIWKEAMSKSFGLKLNKLRHFRQNVLSRSFGLLG